MFLLQQRAANVWLIWPLATSKTQNVWWLISFVCGHIVIANRPSVHLFLRVSDILNAIVRPFKRFFLDILAEFAPHQGTFGFWTTAAQGLCPRACVSGRRTSCRRSVSIGNVWGHARGSFGQHTCDHGMFSLQATKLTFVMQNPADTKTTEFSESRLKSDRQRKLEFMKLIFFEPSTRLGVGTNAEARGIKLPVSLWHDTHAGP